MGPRSGAREHLRRVDRAPARLLSTVLVLWSRLPCALSGSIRGESRHPAREPDSGVTDSNAMPLRFHNLQAVDLSEWDGSATDGRLGRLFAVIQSLTSRQRHPPSLPCPRADSGVRHLTPRPGRTPVVRADLGGDGAKVRGHGARRRRPLPRRRPRHRVRATAASAASAGVLASWSGRCRCVHRGRDRRHRLISRPWNDSSVEADRHRLLETP